MGEFLASPMVDDRVGKILAEEKTGRAGVSILNLRYGLEDKPGPVPAVLFGLQHVLVMFTAMIAAPLVIGQLLNLSPAPQSFQACRFPKPGVGPFLHTRVNFDSWVLLPVIPESTI